MENALGRPAHDFPYKLEGAHTHTCVHIYIYIYMEDIFLETWIMHWTNKWNKLRREGTILSLSCDNKNSSPDKDIIFPSKR